MKKAIAGLLAGLFVLGLMASGSGGRQLEQEIDAVQQRWLDIKASHPDQVTVTQARDLWRHTRNLTYRYADNPQVRVWENRAWDTYRRHLRQAEGRQSGWTS